MESRFAELENIKTWAVSNNLKLNTSKTVEIVFSKPRSRTVFNSPPSIPGIQRVEFVKILGVTIGRTFSMRDHVSEVLGACARSLYALRTLRSHGMSNTDLQMIFRSVIVLVSFPCMKWIFECIGEKYIDMMDSSNDP